MAKSPRGGRKSSAQQPGRLRIVAGKWRRRLLPVVDVAGLRPTPERVRETLFNWLAPRIDGARCLDLCAGSGALGFEALSRGASHAVMVERAKAAVHGLRSSADLLGAELGTDLRIVESDARQFLRQSPAEPYDLVFLDPPFQDDLLPELCRLLQQRAWLARDALVYIEHDREAPPDSLPSGWAIRKQSNAGNVTYLLLSPEPEETGSARP
ncbi:MAG: 16S rRNA (guanine(966)-N(2))-methyltransferase RsmD [Woeseia sp.]